MHLAFDEAPIGLEDPVPRAVGSRHDGGARKPHGRIAGQAEFPAHRLGHLPHVPALGHADGPRLPHIGKRGLGHLSLPRLERGAEEFPVRHAGQSRVVGDEVKRHNVEHLRHRGRYRVLNRLVHKRRRIFHLVAYNDSHVRRVGIQYGREFKGHHGPPGPVQVPDVRGLGIEGYGNLCAVLRPQQRDFRYRPPLVSCKLELRPYDQIKYSLGPTRRPVAHPRCLPVALPSRPALIRARPGRPPPRAPRQFAPFPFPSPRPPPR